MEQTTIDQEPVTERRQNLGEVLQRYLRSTEAHELLEQGALTTNGMLEAIGFDLNLRNIMQLHRVLRSVLCVQRKIDGRRVWLRSLGASANDPLEDEAQFDLLSAHVATRPESSFPLSNEAIGHALGLIVSEEMIQTIMVTMNELGFVWLNRTFPGNPPVHNIGWVRANPKYAIGDQLIAIDGEHKGLFGRVKQRMLVLDQILYQLDGHNGLWLPEAWLDQFDRAPPTPSTIHTRPPNLTGALTEFIVLLFSVQAIAGFDPRLLQNPNARQTQWLEHIVTLLNILRRTFQQRRINSVDSLFLALYESLIIGAPGTSALNQASLTVARVRGEYGDSNAFGRPPEAAGWVCIFAHSIGKSLELANEFEAKRQHAEAERWHKHAHALQWMVDALGGLPRGEPFTIPPNELGKDFGNSEGAEPHEVLDLTVAQVWAQSLLEPLREKMPDEFIELMERRIAGALHLAHARRLPDEIETVRRQVAGVVS